MTETIRQALDALRGNLLRSALTLVGMAIGVFSVIASVTAVGVLESTLMDSLSAMGSQTVTLTRVKGDGSAGEADYDRRALTFEQAARLAERVELATSVSPSVQTFGGQLKAGEESTDPNVTVLGADEAYAVNHGLELAAGRWLGEDDVRVARPVAVLGSTVATRLFEGRDAVGREVRVDGRRHVVVGVLDEQSGGFGMFDPNNLVAAPVTRVLAAYGLADDDVTIDVRAPSPEAVASVRDETIGAMRAIRRVAPEAESDFEVETSDAALEGFKSFTGALALGGAAVGLISLLAAGVGVMNIMLVSVTERTREIGVRKSLGATRADIRRQFLVEAVVLCQIGGLVGVVAGVVGGNLLTAVLGGSVAVPWGWALGALAGVTLVALAFGVYPATQAAKLRPIEALRYE